MTVADLAGRVPEYAKDLKLNLSSVLTPQGAPGLSREQIHAVALAAAVASRNRALTDALDALAAEHLDETARTAARAAAAIMGMNNVYYRFTELVGDEEYRNLPARLRMSVIARPGVERADFELCSLAVSAVNGCGACVKAHEHTLREQGLGREAIQSAVRIAAVVHAIAVTLDS